MITEPDWNGDRNVQVIMRHFTSDLVTWLTQGVQVCGFTYRLFKKTQLLKNKVISLTYKSILLQKLLRPSTDFSEVYYLFIFFLFCLPLLVWNNNAKNRFLECFLHLLKIICPLIRSLCECGQMEDIPCCKAHDRLLGLCQNAPERHIDT